MSQRIIEVIEYDPNWQIKFTHEKQLLADAIGSNAINIEHIGSTSVVGLAAKPVIDILIEVTSLTVLDAAHQQMAALGYLVKGEYGIDGRRYFQKGGNQRSHHVHAFQSGDINLLRHRAFKAYLIAHPAIAMAYGKIKKDAALQCAHDNEHYMALKNEFIQTHEQLALKWYNNN